MATHELKTDPAVFDEVAAGRKTFEIRFNDRNFQVGNKLVLRRTRLTGWTMKQCNLPLEYTGEQVERTVTHILRGPLYGLAAGWVIMSLCPLPADQ